MQPGQSRDTQSRMDEFVHMDATEQGRLVRDGEVTALELTEAAIGRIERLNPRINALASADFDLARQHSRDAAGQGVFAGVPTLLKDLLAYPGYECALGSRLFKGQKAQGGSPYTEALDESGLVVLGKSATSEFGLLGTTETAANGATRNPWDLRRSPGGSSGGAVAAVASGMVAIAHASDGGGSIRGPASFCGLFGFKPSRGRTVSAGMPADLPTAGLVSEHCVSRSVRDSAAWLEATEQPDQGRSSSRDSAPAPLRIGAYRCDAFGRPPSPEADAALETAWRLCQDLGHEVVEIESPPFDADETSRAFFALTGLVLNGMVAQFRAMMGAAFDDTLLEPHTREVIRRAQGLGPEAYERSQSALTDAERGLIDAMAPFDAVLSPTVPFAAFELGQYGPDRDTDALIDFTGRLAGYRFAASMAGSPAMSVSLYWTDEGLPIGCHFAASPGRDEVLFSLAYQLEAAAPWQPRLVALAEALACRSD